MPTIRFDIKFTERERALLRKRATSHRMTEADYLRVCMIADGFMSGDPDAIAATRDKLKDKVKQRLESWNKMVMQG